MQTIFFILLFSIVSVVSVQAEEALVKPVSTKSDQKEGLYLDVDVEKLSDSNISFQAWDLTRPGKYQKALDFCDKVLRHKAHSAEAHFGRARALTMLDRDEEAVDSYNLAIKYKYECTGELYYHKGLSLAELGRYEEAIKAYDLAIKHGYEDGHVYYAKDDAEMKLGIL